jgi:hypothetical protein
LQTRRKLCARAGILTAPGTSETRKTRIQPQRPPGSVDRPISGRTHATRFAPQPFPMHGSPRRNDSLLGAPMSPGRNRYRMESQRLRGTRLVYQSRCRSSQIP